MTVAPESLDNAQPMPQPVLLRLADFAPAAEPRPTPQVTVEPAPGPLAAASTAGSAQRTDPHAAAVLPSSAASGVSAWLASGYGPHTMVEPAVEGWVAGVVAGLPRLRPAPVLVAAEPLPPVPRRGRKLITECEARGLAGSTARAVLEVLEGRRSVQQLDPMLDRRALAAVRTMLGGGLRWPVRRPTVVSVRVHLPSARAVEACVLFRSDERTRALAMRIDRDRRRWVTTAVRVG